MLAGFACVVYSQAQPEIGREVAIPHHLQDGEECDISGPDLIAYGKKLFAAHFTREGGAGRLLTTLQSIAKSRAEPDMFGSGYYEMLACQIKADLQSIRDRPRRGQRARLVSKGISFDILARNTDGSWNTSAVEGLPSESTGSTDASMRPACSSCRSAKLAHLPIQFCAKLPAMASVQQIGCHVPALPLDRQSWMEYRKRPV